MSNLFGWLALIFSIISLCCNKKFYILLFQIPANICYSISYFCIGSAVGWVSVVVATIRAITFFIFDKCNKTCPKLIMFIFVFATIISGVINFETMIDILPIVGISVFTYVTWQKSETIIKIGSIILSICLLIYNMFMCMWVSFLQESILLMVAVISLKKTYFCLN